MINRLFAAGSRVGVFLYLVREIIEVSPCGIFCDFQSPLSAYCFSRQLFMRKQIAPRWKAP
jgi:hypothetical protein